MTYHLIDPPVTPYSDPDDIRAWLAELEQMEETPEVQEAIDNANSWLGED